MWLVCFLVVLTCIINVVVAWFACGLCFGDVAATQHLLCETMLLGVLQTYAQPLCRATLNYLQIHCTLCYTQRCHQIIKLDAP